MRVAALVGLALTLGYASEAFAVSWRAPTCTNGTFSGCGWSTQPRCTDSGGPGYPNYDPSYYGTCQAACALPNPDSYCTWQPPQCDGTTFKGCGVVGHATCSDFGGPGYPNFKSELWTACNNACNSSSRDLYCAWKPPQVLAGDFSGCSATNQPVCTDFGSASVPNWTPALWTACQTYCSSTCPAANPNDNLADDAALQACLDQGGTVRLRPGSKGYFIASGLLMSHDSTVLTSAAAPGRARLVAMPGLTNTMLIASDVSDVSVSYIEFNGNRANRTVVPSCQGNRAKGSNVSLLGMDGGSFTNNRSTQAACGTAVGFNGSDFELAFNLIDDNGHGREAIDAPEPWSDGITIGLCTRSNLHHNYVTDATDIGIVDGGGEDCLVRDNNVIQLNRYAFAGIHVTNFPAEGAGTHTRSDISANRVFGYGKMSFGIAYGAHPWNTSLLTTGGTVRNNTIFGAIIDLMVDGVSGVTVSGNSLGGAQGTPGCGVGLKLYTVGHAQSSSLTSGYTSTTFDHCIP